MTNLFSGKSILVTGGTGSIGSEIVCQLLQQNPRQVRVYSRSEEKQFFLQQELSGYGNLRFLIGDVRDYRRVNYAVKGVDFVFHAAAMKHVPASEYNPLEAVKTNVLGTQNVIESSIEHNVQKVIGISTDKVVNPSNTMGATKLLSEKILMSANQYKGAADTLFSAVRFGNVMGSSGSVIPLFAYQILNGKPITVTDTNMTRFMMSIPQAAGLVLQAAENSRYGETFVLKMPTIKVNDIAETIIEDYNASHDIPYTVPIEIIGARPGEKTYEELMTDLEIKRSFENDKMYLIPSQWNEANEFEGFRPAGITSYSSVDGKMMSKIEFRSVLHKYKLLPWIK